jgi:hypothetical protein
LFLVMIIGLKEHRLMLARNIAECVFVR